MASKVPDIRVAEIVFSDRVVLHFPFTANVDSAVNAVDSTPYLGSTTNIADGLQLATQTIQSDNIPSRTKVVMLITDGKANVNEDRINPESAILRGQAAIYAVGITDAIDRAELLVITGGAADQLIEVIDFASLNAKITPLIATVCGKPSPGKFIHYD